MNKTNINTKHGQSSPRCYSTLIGLIALGLIAGCSSSTQTKEGSSQAEPELSRADSLLGTWQWSEMTSGVQFSTTFQPKGQLAQHFLSLNDGHAKDRLGTWELIGSDSLIIRDAQGPDTLRIVKLSADYLELMRSDSIPLFFERKAEEAAQ